jgi:hypothetical protein
LRFSYLGLGSRTVQIDEQANCSDRRLSFPKIISARSEDAIRARLVW